MGRRQVLEENPVASINEGAVVFDTSEVPWWAWVRRFHLPEVRLLMESHVTAGSNCTIA